MTEWPIHERGYRRRIDRMLLLRWIDIGYLYSINWIVKRKPSKSCCPEIQLEILVEIDPSSVWQDETVIGEAVQEKHCFPGVGKQHTDCVLRNRRAKLSWL